MKVINKIAEGNEIKTRNCFKNIFSRKNRTLNSDRNRNIILIKNKNHAILV